MPDEEKYELDLDPRIQALILKLLCDGHNVDKIKDLIKEKYDLQVALVDVELIAKSNSGAITETKQKLIQSITNKSLRDSLDRISWLEKQANIYERALREFDSHDKVKIVNINQYMKVQERWLAILDQVATEMGVKKNSQLNIFMGDKLVGQLVDKMMANKTSQEIYTDIDKIREDRDRIESTEGEITDEQPARPEDNSN